MKSRDSRYGETKDATTVTPCSASRLAMYPVRRRCSSRSARVKPVLGNTSRSASPSMYSTSTPRRTSSSWTRTAMVLLPDPDRPVNQSTAAGALGGLFTATELTAR
jgi:hypothetical protein